MRKLFVLVLTVVLSAGMMSAAHAKAKYAVTLTPSKTSLDVGQSLKLTGKVTPAAKGTSVKVQRKYAGGSWKTIATTKLSKTSTYAVTVKPTRGGPTQYRVQKPASSSRSTGNSPAKTVNVFKWLDLTSTPSRLAIGVAPASATSMIRTATFGRSLTFGGSASFIGWDLGVRKCDAYRTFVGTTPDSDSQVESAFEIHLYQTADFEVTTAVLDETNGMRRGDYARYIERPFPTDVPDRYLGIVVHLGGSGVGTAVLAEPAAHCNANS